MREMRWLLWFRCMDCRAIAKEHDGGLPDRHDEECPVAASFWPADMPDYRHHFWVPGRLMHHACDFAGESLASEATPTD